MVSTAALALVAAATFAQKGDKMGRPSDWRQAADDTADEIEPTWRETAAKKAYYHPLEKVNAFSYEIMYGDLLASMRHRPVTMLEMGVNRGHSQLLWRKYFPRAAMIWGMAYPPPPGVAMGARERITDNNELVYCSQVNVTCLNALMTSAQSLSSSSSSSSSSAPASRGGFDLIIDDASHVPQHNIFTMIKLWPSLKPGGLYVIEDLQTSYWRGPPPWSPNELKLYGNSLRGTGLGGKGNAVEYLKYALDLLFLHQVRAHTVFDAAVDAEIGTATFSNYIAALRKKDARWAAVDATMRQRESRKVDNPDMWSNFEEKVIRQTQHALMVHQQQIEHFRHGFWCNKTDTPLYMAHLQPPPACS